MTTAIPLLQQEHNRIVRSLQAAYADQYLFSRANVRWAQRKSQFPKITVPDRTDSYERICRAKEAALRDVDAMYEYWERQIQTPLTCIQQNPSCGCCHGYLDHCLASLYSFHRQVDEALHSELQRASRHPGLLDLTEELHGRLGLYDDVYRAVTNQ